MTIAEDKLKEVAWRIHVIPELSGCIIGYYGDSGCRVEEPPTQDGASSVEPLNSAQNAPWNISAA